MSQINLRQDERRCITNDEGQEEIYADLDVVPYRSVYNLMGYNTRTQLFRLFSNTTETYTLQELHDMVEGDSDDIAEDLQYMYNIGMIRCPSTGIFTADMSSPIMEEIDDLFTELETESSDQDSWIRHARE